uniref:Uncharacterized protein n=1 Tax=Rhizophora mucronata TaxID=61149 RepID=A0A2P2NSY9_RHIMU
MIIKIFKTTHLQFRFQLNGKEKDGKKTHNSCVNRVHFSNFYNIAKYYAFRKKIIYSRKMHRKINSKIQQKIWCYWKQEGRQQVS